MNQLRWTAIRDIVLFVGGLAGAAHEVVLTNTERPTLLILFAAMMGLPAVLRQDANKNDSLKDIKDLLTRQDPTPPSPPKPPEPEPEEVPNPYEGSGNE